MRNGDMRFCEKSLFGLEDAVFRFETCRVADGSKEKTKEYCKDYELLTINFLKRILVRAFAIWQREKRLPERIQHWTWALWSQRISPKLL